MKRIVIAVSVVVLVLAVAVWAQTPAQTKSGSVEQELMKLENQWNDVWVKSDVAFLDRILAEDWMLTDADGVVGTKAQSFASLKSGEDVVTSAVADEMKVRVYGDGRWSPVATRPKRR